MFAGSSRTKLCAGCGSFTSRPIFRPPGVFCFCLKPHENTLRGRATAAADLVPPKEVGFEFVLESAIGQWIEDDEGYFMDSDYDSQDEDLMSRPGHGVFNQPLGTTLPPSLDSLWL